MYQEFFWGIGTFKNYKYHIELNSKVKSGVHPSRRFALSLEPKMEKELDEMVKQGIIVPVDEPTDWVNSLVVRGKPSGSVRISIRPLIGNIVPAVDMVTCRLQGATLFFFHI